MCCCRSNIYHSSKLHYLSGLDLRSDSESIHRQNRELGSCLKKTTSLEIAVVIISTCCTKIWMVDDLRVGDFIIWLDSLNID